MGLPPGPRYLVRLIPELSLPPLLAFAFLHVLSIKLSIPIPLYLRVLAFALSWPLAFVVLVQWRSWINKRNAAALGAVMPAEVEHKLPGSLDLLMKMFEDDRSLYLASYLFKHTEKYGNTFNLRVMFEDRIFTCEPEYIKTIVATDFSSYEKGPLLKEHLNTLLGSGVFNSDDVEVPPDDDPALLQQTPDHALRHLRPARGARARQGRRASQGGRARRLAGHRLALRNGLRDRVRLRQGRPLSRHPTPYPSSFTLATASAPSDRPNGTAEEREIVHPADRFVRSFQDGLEATAMRGRFMQSYLLFEFWGDRVEWHIGEVHRFIDPIVWEVLRRKAERLRAGEGGDVQKDVRDGETLLEHLVKFTDDAKVLKDEALNILLAGRDTTACTLAFAVFALAEHPAVLARLWHEVLDVVGPSRRPTYGDVREMTYMRAFINEVLRLFPPVPFNTRCSIKGMTWKSTQPGQPDFYIPPRTLCVYSVLLMHHSRISGAVVRPGAVSRRVRAEVPRPEPVHLPSVQRRPADLSRPAVRVQRDLVHARAPPAALREHHPPPGRTPRGGAPTRRRAQPVRSRRV